MNIQQELIQCEEILSKTNEVIVIKSYVYLEGLQM
jgi:hypothetical protein